MICDLIVLAEISHELSEMDKGETFSLFCEQNASKCCDLKFAVWDSVLGKTSEPLSYPKALEDNIVEMGWAIRNLAHELERHFMKRMTQRAGKGL